MLTGWVCGGDKDRGEAHAMNWAKSQLEMDVMILCSE
jgi:hypothetical protein